MTKNLFVYSALLALGLALGAAVRLNFLYGGFRRTVNTALATSEGYDQKFIDLVNHLEEVLAIRASFAYPGGRDPMTGRSRSVAEAGPAPITRKIATHTPKGQPATAAPKADSVYVDPMKLTAIIEDDNGTYTAIVMDGERSMSVDAGDLIGNRKITRISARELVMESDSLVFTYGIAGTRDRRRK